MIDELAIMRNRKLALSKQMDNPTGGTFIPVIIKDSCEHRYIRYKTPAPWEEALVCQFCGQERR